MNTRAFYRLNRTCAIHYRHAREYPLERSSSLEIDHWRVQSVWPREAEDGTLDHERCRTEKNRALDVRCFEARRGSEIHSQSGIGAL